MKIKYLTKILNVLYKRRIVSLLVWSSLLLLAILMISFSMLSQTTSKQKLQARTQSGASSETPTRADYVAIARVLHDQIKEDGGQTPYLTIKGKKYQIRNFWKGNPTNSDTFNDVVFNEDEKELTLKFKDKTITEENLIAAYKLVNEAGIKLYDYLRPFLKHYWGPDWVTVQTKENQSVRIKIDELVLRHRQDLKAINKKILSGQHDYLKTTSDIIYQIVSDKISDQVKAITIWSVLRNFFKTKLWTPSQNQRPIDIEDQTYDFQLLFAARAKSEWVSLSQNAKDQITKLIRYDVKFNALKNALNINDNNLAEMRIAQILQAIRGNSGGNSPFILIENESYAVADFWRVDLQNFKTISFKSPSTTRLITKYLNNEITKHDLSLAYSNVQWQATTLWNYLRPFLKYYQGPDKISLFWAENSSLEVRMDHFKTGENYSLAKINQENRKDKDNPMFSAIAHGLYNTVTYKIVDQLKLRIVWSTLHHWFINKLWQPSRDANIKIKGADYDFNLLYKVAQAEWGEDYNKIPELAQNELKRLVSANVDFDDLKTALNAPVTTTSSQQNNQQKSTNQNLAIGLGTAGGVVALAGIGGFIYWFLKIRKN